MVSNNDLSKVEFGFHYIVELADCNKEKLRKIPFVEKVFLEAAKKSNATILNTHFHQFEPDGVSGVILIAESHFTIHTWPDESYAAIDIFTCGVNMKAQVAIDIMKESFESKSVKIDKIIRTPHN